MVDPPDLEDNSTLNGNNFLSFVSSSSPFTSFSQDRIHINRKSPRSASLLRHNLAIVLLCLFACLASLSYCHALPSRNHGTSGEALGALQQSPYIEHVLSFDTPKLESESILTNAGEDFYQRNLHHQVPTKSGAFQHLGKRQVTTSTGQLPACTSTKSELPTGRKIGFAILVVALVLMSGVFAGLTLGYMSLDETQLQVLMSTGSDIQKARAAKIIPIRKDGHLLLSTLLIANMITNETLPIIFDPLLPNQVLSVVISTILIVIFAELIPQSTCSRYGLQIGAYMAFPTRIIIIILWPIAWPVSRILHWVLGAHHGIVYRRAELKELVTMHAASGGRGGDLKGDTVMIVGGALDLQEKVVKQAMTPIDQVFMLPFTAKLDYPTLEKVVRSGHSRIPIYQEIEVEVGPAKSGSTTPKKKLPLLSTFTRKTSTDDAHGKTGSPRLDSKEQATLGQTEGEGFKTTEIRKKIVGTLLVKSCVLLDPEDAVPVSSMVINALPTVPADEPLLNVLNAFQEGRSHMAIVSPRSRRGISDSIADLGSKSNLYRSGQGHKVPVASAVPRVDGLDDIDEEKNVEFGNDLTRSNSEPHSSSHASGQSSGKTRNESSPKRRHLWSRAFGRGEENEGLEQTMPADAIVDEKTFIDGQNLRRWESNQTHQASSTQDNGLPLGIITLEDVLEELLGEEILDEYDDRGNEEQDFRNLMPPPSPEHGIIPVGKTGVVTPTEEGEDKQLPGPAIELTGLAITQQGQNTTQVVSSPHPPPPSLPLKKTMLTRLGLARQRSQRDSITAPSSASAINDEPNNVEHNDDTIMGDALVSSPLPPNTSSSNGYFEAHLHRPRASSVPAIDREEPEQVRGRSISRPPSPNGQSILANPSSTPFNGPILYSPQPNRAILIRTQALGGTPVTTIANESLLRGRQQSLPIPTPGISMTSTSRSQTPAGGASAGGANKGNRFKSQAVVGVGGTATGASISVPSRSRSQIRPSVGDPDTDENQVDEDN